MRTLPLLFLLSLALLLAPAAGLADEGDGVTLLPPRVRRAGLVYLPKLYYGSQTSLGFGGEIMRPFRFPGTDVRTRDSDVRLKGRVTLKGQSALELRSTLYFGDCHWLSSLKLRYDSLPQRFWGLGPEAPSTNEEKYRPQHLLGYVELYRCVLPQLRLGVRAEIEDVKYLEVETDGLLDLQGYRGVDGGHAAGAGLVFDWDRRDRRYSTTRGSWVQGFALCFDDELGSDFDFNQYNLDARHYLQPREGLVLASQVFLYAARGAAPIWRLASLGGREHTRGYRQDRYLDRVLLAFQEELRFPLAGRLGGVAFAGLGHVAPTWGSLRLETMRPTVGMGLRYRTGGAEGVRIRVDVAFGEDSLRAYLALDEAF